MRTFFRKYSRLIASIFAVLVGLLLIVTATFMLSDYKSEISERAIDNAKYNTIVARDNFYQSFEKFNNKAVEIATEASQINEEVDFLSYLSSKALVSTDVEDVDNIKLIKYYKDGYLYTHYGDLEVSPGGKTSDPSFYIYDEIKDKTTFVGYYNYTGASIDDNQTICGFYTPMKNNTFADGIVVYYPRNILQNVYKPENASSLREFSIIVDANLDILTGDVHENSAFVMTNVFQDAGNLYDKFLDETGTNVVSNQLLNAISQRKDGQIEVRLKNDDYIISLGIDDNQMRNIIVVELYKKSVLCESSMEYVNTITSIVVIFTVIVISLLLYLIIYNASIRRRLLNIGVTNAMLQCFNRNGFEKSASEILSRNTNSYFACMVLEIRHFQFIKESTSEAELNAVLRYIRYVLSKTIKIEEQYGYGDAGEFLLLAHAKDRSGLVDRLKIFNSILSKNKIANKLDILIKFGIYEVDFNEKISVSKMLDYAHEANNTIVKANNENAGMQFNFYDVELRNIRIINEDMELRMESALKNGEFQVFYQPKYNLNLNRQDGAEALVRWYDKATGVYNRPDLFMSLFESNGFVVKLDKYVFERVCEYISYSVAHGRTVYPISVNISRVTAIQLDFVDYYSKIKRKYSVSDGQIMIEFTESFAYENYEMLYKIVEGLHNAGFKCSIDDFGCGYSSYRILKSLPMDEIKLDKFFMERGLDENRDNDIFDSIIRLAKKLHMKVTQEGVEKKDGVNLLRKMGCDVIQGYFYAHPMPLSDYIKFVATSREHDIK